MQLAFNGQKNASCWLGLTTLYSLEVLLYCKSGNKQIPLKIELKVDVIPQRLILTIKHTAAAIMNCFRKGNKIHLHTLVVRIHVPSAVIYPLTFFTVIHTS